MSYKYKGFIPQNIAPKGATQIGVYDKSGKRLFGIPLGRLARPQGEKCYSFGLVSDIHLWHLSAVWNPNEKFDNALSFFEDQGCVMCIVSGDLTQTGFYRKVNESDPDEIPYFENLQFAKYKEICDKHTIPVYELCGNHESFYGKDITLHTGDQGELKAYTQNGALSYTVTQGDDLFILIGQPHGTTPMTDDDLGELRHTLQANRDKRCFVFIHPNLTNDSGNANGAYTSNQFFKDWGHTAAFKELLSEHKNTILFHGHSHMMFECQEVDECANYTEKNGFCSVHIPSLSRPCAIVNGKREYQNDKSQGYIVDVYDDCVVLNGLDLLTDTVVPIATYAVTMKGEVTE